MKTAVSLPDPVFEAAEQAASKLGISRSELYARAIARYVREEGGEAITEAIDRVVSARPSDLDRILVRIQTASLGPDEGSFEDWVSKRPKRG